MSCARHPKLFAVPFTYVTEVRIASYLAGATGVDQGEVVAEFQGDRASEKELVDASAVGHGTAAMNDGNRSETVEVTQ